MVLGVLPEPEARRGASGVSFPDCWLAFGATDVELRTYGTAHPLNAKPAYTLVLAQVCLVALLVPAALWLPGSLPAAAALLLGVVLCSALVGTLRLLRTPHGLQLRPAGLELRLPLGRQRIGWERLAEISRVRTPSLAVGLRLHPSADPSSRFVRWLGGVARRLQAGYDLILLPDDGDCDRLARVLLRYCLDPTVRRRLM